jgi:hypothetical protein
MHAHSISSARSCHHDAPGQAQASHQQPSDAKPRKKVLVVVLLLLLLLKRASAPKPPLPQRLRKHPDIQQAKQIPFGTGLGLKVPKDPPLTIPLVHIQLRLNILTHIILEGLRPGLDEVDRLARPAVGGAGKGPVIAGADAVAVKRSRTVGHGRGPLADDEPLVAPGRVSGCVVADELAVLPGRHGGEVVAEDLVFVVVDDDVLGVVVGWAEEAVPGLGGGEAVVEDDGGVAGLADGVEAVAVVGFG